MKKNSAINEQPAKRRTRKQAVTAKHTVTYEQPEIIEVPAEIADTENDLLDLDPLPLLNLDDDDDEQPRQPTFRQKLKEKFARKGIGHDEMLNMRIDRLPTFSASGMAGIKSDKAFCGVMTVTDKFFDTDEYLTEIQRRYGPGEYWLTVRHKNIIVQQWRETIEGFTAQPIITQSENGQPQIIYQQPATTPAQAPKTLNEQLRDVAEVIKVVDGIRGKPVEQITVQNPAVSDPDVILLQSLAGNDQFMNKINAGVVKKLLGDNAAPDEPGWSSVVMKAVETNQIGPAIDALGRIAASLLERILPARAPQNGPAPAQGQAPAALPEQPQPEAPQDNQSQVMSPEDEALNIVMTGCQRNMPVAITYERLMGWAEKVETEAPQYSIYGFIDLFMAMTPDNALAFVRTLPNGATIADLPHAKEWTEKLQHHIKENQGEPEQ